MIKQSMTQVAQSHARARTPVRGGEIELDIISRNIIKIAEYYPGGNLRFSQTNTNIFCLGVLQSGLKSWEEIELINKTCKIYTGTRLLKSNYSVVIVELKKCFAKYCTDNNARLDYVTGLRQDNIYDFLLSDLVSTMTPYGQSEARGLGNEICDADSEDEADLEDE